MASVAVGLFVAAACTATVLVGTAQAGTEECIENPSNHYYLCKYNAKLRANEWTTDAVVGHLYYIASDNYEGSVGAHCVGPVTHDGSGYHFPYGWKCEGVLTIWSFATISAAAGEKAASTGTDKFNATADYAP